MTEDLWRYGLNPGSSRPLKARCPVCFAYRGEPCASGDGRSHAAREALRIAEAEAAPGKVRYAPLSPQSVSIVKLSSACVTINLPKIYCQYIELCKIASILVGLTITHTSMDNDGNTILDFNDGSTLTIFGKAFSKLTFQDV